MLFPRDISKHNVVELHTFDVFFRQPLKYLSPKPALVLGCANLRTVLLDFILTSNALRIHLQSCEGMGHAPPGNYTVSINVLLTMDVKNCEGTQPLNTSKRSFNFLTLFLDLTLTSNILFTYSCTSPGERGGGGAVTIILS